MQDALNNKMINEHESRTVGKVEYLEIIAKQIMIVVMLTVTV